METLLVTGATGFIGKHFIEQLKQSPYKERYKIVALSTLPVAGLTTVLHQDYSFTPNAFIKAGIDQIDTVIHIGAFTPKNSGQANDISKTSNNIITLDHLLGNLPGTPSKFIFLSTLDVYDPGYNGIITEQSPVLPASLYGWSKLYGEKIIAAWALANKTICQILRIGHVYGPGEEKYRKIIPETIKKLLNNQPPQIWGSGSELRSFIYISDVIKAILNSILLTSYVGPINIVSERSISINDLIQQLIRISNRSTGLDYISGSEPGRSIIFDNSRMKELLCTEAISLEEGLKKEWIYMSQCS